jgi:hypothetical protein
MGLQKLYIVTEISAAPDGSPFVFLTLRDPSEIRGPQKPASAAATVSFTSMNDMFRNLGRVISKQMIGGFATIIKLSLAEYEQLDFKVGDRVSLDITKTQLSVP